MKIEEALKELIETSDDKTSFVESDVFHHNAPYEAGLSILKNGILPASMQNERGISNRDEHVFIDGNKMDIGTVNGYNDISISRVYGEHPYYDQDFGYCPYNPSMLDFILDKSMYKDLPMGHNNENYYNEYLVRSSVPTKYIKSLNVRLHNMTLLKDVKFCDVKYCLEKNDSIFRECYNNLIDMATYITESGLNIPICEIVSNSSVYTLDPKKVMKLSKLK